MKFNKKSRNAILGCVLGDGCINKNGSIKLLHCEKQRDYLEWKIKYLKSCGVKCGELKLFDNSGFPGCRVYVNVTKWSKFLRRLLYKDSKKNIYNRKLLNRLEPVHLAIWYMDDGGLSQKHKNGKLCANELMINTHTTKENNQILIDYFHEVWDVRFTQCLNKGKYRLRCGTKEARKFIDIVREYVQHIPSMEHKLKIKPIAPL